MTTAPSPQTAIDAAPGRWTSRFPPPFDGLAAGPAPLFEDSNIEWALGRFDGIAGKSVLELGPLEGAHSYMAQKAGAASVTAVEANPKAFLKCLIVKDLLALDRCSFLCGDALEFLAGTNQQFDVCIACGILYHMVEPVRLLDLVSRRASRLILWTHVYTDQVLADKQLAKRFGAAETTDYAGFRYSVHRHNYRSDLRLTDYCGGSRPYSNWLAREDLLRALDHFGWQSVEIGFDEMTPNGPALGLVAERRPHA